jgi:CelD/BcsL family acetyltransferase involved in cellulose biosynthesis
MASESTAAAARFGAPVEAARATAKGAAERLAAVELYRDLAAAEPAWRALEPAGVLSPYQRFDWIAAWHRHAGSAAGVAPLVVVGFDRQADPLFLWPFGYDPRSSLRKACFLGGKHANFNFGPWRRDAGIGAVEITHALARLRALAPEVDALALVNQPVSWEQMPNPLLALPHQESPSEGYRLTLAGGGAAVLARAYSSHTRARLRNKERKLQTIPGYRYTRATTPTDVDRYLDAFFVQKAERLAAQGIENVFAAPGVRAFLREACLCGLDAGTPLVELHVLDSDAGMLALFGGVSDGRRFSGMINSIRMGEHVKYSPGLILLDHLVADCADRGLVMFDLGVGEAEYKALLCDETEPLFDSFVPLSPRGRLLAPALSLKARAKRTIKHSPTLWQLVQKLRRFR